MAPILGIPFLHWLLAGAVSQGISRFLLLTGYKSEKIRNYFGDGSALGCSIAYSHEERPLGSGGALWNAVELLENEFLYMNGDDYPDLQIPDFVGAFRRSDKSALVAVCKDDGGRLAVDDATGLVCDYKPDSWAQYLDCGTKAFRKEVLDLVEAPTPFILERELWPILIRQEQLVSYELASRPQAIDTPDSLRRLEEWFRRQGGRQPRLSNT